MMLRDLVAQIIDMRTGLTGKMVEELTDEILVLTSPARTEGLRKAERVLLENLETVDVQERTVTLTVSTALWENWQDDTRHHPIAALNPPAPESERWRCTNCGLILDDQETTAHADLPTTIKVWHKNSDGIWCGPLELKGDKE